MRTRWQRLVCCPAARPARCRQKSTAPERARGAVRRRADSRGGRDISFGAVQEWFRRYRANDPDRMIAYDAVGSGEGIRRFLVPTHGEASVDFGASDAALQIRNGGGAGRRAPRPADGRHVALAYDSPMSQGRSQNFRATSTPTSSRE